MKATQFVAYGIGSVFIEPPKICDSLANDFAVSTCQKTFDHASS